MAKRKNVVKKTQMELTFVLAAVLVFSWIMTAMYIAGNDDEKKQQVLIQEAEKLLTDKIYLRAASRYETAINSYSTDLNPELEKKLLSIYKEGGLEEQYVDFVKSRISAGTAQAEEYIDYANLLIERGSAVRAVEVLALGEEQYDDDGLTGLYESMKYECSARDINYAETKMPSADWLVPASNGEKWGFINSGGYTELDFVYEEATRFSGNYAVVKIDGVYTLIDKAGNWIAVDKAGYDEIIGISGDKIIGVKESGYYICSYTFERLNEEVYENAYLNDNGCLVVKKDGRWAVLNSELENITDFIYEDVAVNSVGQVFSGNFAVVKDSKGYFLLNIKGEPCFEKRYEDAKGFEGGLIAVSEDGNTWGFINSSAEYIVEPQYEDAYSFSCDLAAVKSVGKWGYINRYNSMVIENEYERTFPFIEGKAFVEDSIGNKKVVSLKYYESF